jgi:hypothetical protein
MSTQALIAMNKNGLTAARTAAVVSRSAITPTSRRTV